MEHGYVPGENWVNHKIFSIREIFIKAEILKIRDIIMNFQPITVIIRRPCCKKYNDEQMCAPAVSKKAIK